MDEFEKNNELENEAEGPEITEEEESDLFEKTVLFDDGKTQMMYDEDATRFLSDDEAAATEDAMDATVALDAEDAKEGVTERIAYPAEDSDSIFAGGDLQSCEDISKEDPEEENPEDIPEDELCKRCYARRRDDSVEGFEYCSVCVEEMAETTVSFGAFFYLFISLLGFCLAALIAVAGFLIAKPVMDTGRLVEEHRLSEAMDKLSEADERASSCNEFLPLPAWCKDMVEFETGTKTLYRYARIINKALGPINASKVLESIEGLNMNRLPSDLKKLNKEYEDIMETDELVYNLFQEYQASVGDGTPDYQTLLTRIDKLVNENENIYKPFVEYYKYYAAKISGESTEVQLSHLKKIEEEYPDNAWLYMTPMLDLYYSSGDYGKAIEYCNKVLKINLNDNSAMIYKARAYFAMDKKDKANEMVELLEKNCVDEGTVAAFKAEMLRRDGKFDEAIAVCDDAIAKDGTLGEAYRQKAIALMLKGDMKKAHEELKTAYDQAELSVELVETLAITASKTGDTELLNELKNLLAYHGIELSATTQACISGTMTVEQIFMEGQGDLR